MIAYILEGAGPQSASADKRMVRLNGAGPWQYQPNQRGAMATWRTGTGPVSRAAFGAERKTSDGMIYLPPKVLPTDPMELLRPAMAMRGDLTDVVVSGESGQTIKIIPAYMSPRQILDDNTLGDFSTAYGRAVRKLLDRVSADAKLKFSDVAEEMSECCRLAIMFSYRMTRGLLQDLGWLSEESLSPIWEACLKRPKATPGAASEN